MQLFKEEDIQKIEEDLALIKCRYAKLLRKIFCVCDVLKSEKSKEYLLHGVARRLDVIERCVENVYSIFPLRRQALLKRDELKDIDINLHAFFINIFGLLDNMAWVVVYEKGGSKTIDKRNVGLYLSGTQEFLSDDFKQYLGTDRMKKWHNEYLKGYRDALSHRIPLYVPPKSLKPDQKQREDLLDLRMREAVKAESVEEMKHVQEEMDKVGDPSPFFVHSLSETDNKVVMLHAQVITDFGTVEEILEKFCLTFDSLDSGAKDALCTGSGSVT